MVHSLCDSQSAFVNSRIIFYWIKFGFKELLLRSVFNVVWSGLLSDVHFSWHLRPKKKELIRALKLLPCQRRLSFRHCTDYGVDKSCENSFTAGSAWLLFPYRQ